MTNQHPRRKSMRLLDYDYSQSGAYFITICTRMRVHRFGQITDVGMLANVIGHTVQACWSTIPDHFAGVELDTFVVMPNHIHGILCLPGGGAALQTIIGTYKAAVTRQIHQQSKAAQTIWQRRYYDHIIRNQQTLDRIRGYIVDNPRGWLEDRLYTAQ